MIIGFFYHHHINQQKKGGTPMEEWNHPMGCITHCNIHIVIGLDPDAVVVPLSDSVQHNTDIFGGSLV